MPSIIVGIGPLAPSLVWSNPAALPAGNGLTWGQVAPGQLPPRLMSIDTSLSANFATQETIEFHTQLTETQKAKLYAHAVANEYRNALSSYDQETQTGIWDTWGKRWAPYGTEPGSGACHPEVDGDIHWKTWYSKLGPIPVVTLYFSSPCTNTEDEFLEQQEASGPGDTIKDDFRIVTSGTFEGQTNMPGMLYQTSYARLIGVVDDTTEEESEPVPPELPPPPTLPPDIPPPPPPPFPPLKGEVKWDEPPPGGGTPQEPKFDYRKDEDEVFRLHITRDTTCDCPEFEPSTTNLSDPVEILIQNFFTGSGSPGYGAIQQYLLDNEPPDGWGGGPVQLADFTLRRKWTNPDTGEVEDREVPMHLPKSATTDMSTLFNEMFLMLNSILMREPPPQIFIEGATGIVVPENSEGVG